ncbi:MAG: alcohol dehydrogenase [Thalassolituus oleivorans]|jgi:alcohol dehydrogenase
MKTSMDASSNVSSVDASVITSIITHTVDELTPKNLFNFNSPRQTIVGEGSILKLGTLLQTLSVKHVLIVADEVVYQKGLLASALRCLARANIAVTVFSGIEREPSSDVVEQGVAMLAQSKADFVLGFGGGSAMDAAKAIALLGSCNASLDELTEPGFDQRRTIGLGAVPTTAGTGSEVTDISVIMHADRSKKFIAKNLDLMPDLAVIDPTLMLGLPASVTAATGIDALTHAIEAYVAHGANHLSRALAISAIKVIPHALSIAVGDGKELSARLEMAVASYSAGLSFSNSGLGLVHALSHQVGAQYGVAHGVANGILLPHVMTFNALVCRREYADIARALGATNEGMNERQQCEAGIESVRQLLSDIGLPNSFAEFGLAVEDFGELADATLQDICITTNPRRVTKTDIIQLLQQVANG